MSLWGTKDPRPPGVGSQVVPRNGPGLVPPLSQGEIQLPGASRESQGIRSLFEHLAGYSGLRILDLGMLSQGTARYLGGLGHRINFASLIHRFDVVRERNRDAGLDLNSELASRIVRIELDFPPNSFHAVLAWDVLQHLERTAMRSAIAHLSKVVRPNGVMFCLFQGDAKNERIPHYDCGVDSMSSFSIREAGRRRAYQQFSARELETLFPQFRAIHFYLKRDALLEVLVIS